MVTFRLTFVLLLLSISAHAQTAERLLILNEGGFGQSNASIDIFDLGSKTIQNDVFASANDDAILGDIAQSAYRFNDDIYVVINNSNRILRLNSESFEIQATKDFVNQESPRTIVLDAEGNVYVTLAGSGEVAKLDGQTLEELKRITVGNWPDKMIIRGNDIFVSNWGSRFFGKPDSTIMTIDVTTDLVIDTLMVLPSPRDMTFDDEGNFWVISSDYGYESAVQIFDSNFGFVKSLDYDGGLGEDISISGEWVYINHAGSGIERIGKTTFEKDSEVFIEGGYYSMKISGGSDPVMAVSDPKDYSQRGEVTIFDLEKTEIARFQSGVIPGHFLFMESEKNVALEQMDVPEKFKVIQAFPNPFNPTTTIAVNPEASGYYQISVFDITGRLLTTIWSGNLRSNQTQKFTWNASGYPSGVYLVKLEGVTSQVLKVQLIK